MAKEDFTDGDLVRLKSGGPIMTLEGEASDGEAICAWFDGQKRHREMFAYTSLEKTEKPSATTAKSDMF